MCVNAELSSSLIAQPYQYFSARTHSPCLHDMLFWHGVTRNSCIYLGWKAWSLYTYIWLFHLEAKYCPCHEYKDKVVLRWIQFLQLPCKNCNKLTKQKLILWWNNWCKWPLIQVILIYFYLQVMFHLQQVQISNIGL